MSQQPDNAELVHRLILANWSRNEFETFRHVYQNSSDDWGKYMDMVPTKSEAQIQDMIDWIKAMTDFRTFSNAELWNTFEYQLKCAHGFVQSIMSQGTEEPHSNTQFHSQQSQPTNPLSQRHAIIGRRLFSDSTVQKPTQHHRLIRKRRPFPLIPTSSSSHLSYKLASFVSGAERHGHDTTQRSPQTMAIFYALRRYLSSPLARRFCIAEFFHSSIDVPIFDHNDMESFMVGIGLHELLTLPTLPRFKWAEIRSENGRNRFSASYINKFKYDVDAARNQQRQRVINGIHQYGPHYKDRFDVIPSVGQTVSAIHPIEKTIHNGIVLNIDRNLFFVRFSHPNLGAHTLFDYQLLCIPQEHEKQHVAKHPRRESPYQPSPGFQHIAPPKMSASSQVTESQTSVSTYAQHETDPRLVAQLVRQLYNKSEILANIEQMNDQAEKNLKETNHHPPSFQKKYASTIIELKNTNANLSQVMDQYNESISMEPQPLTSLPGAQMFTQSQTESQRQPRHESQQKREFESPTTASTFPGYGRPRCSYHATIEQELVILLQNEFKHIRRSEVEFIQNQVESFVDILESLLLCSQDFSSGAIRVADALNSLRPTSEENIEELSRLRHNLHLILQFMSQHDA